MSAVFTCWIPRGLLALTAVGLGYALGARRPDDSGIAPNSLFIHPSATQPNALPPVSSENLAAAPVDAVLAWLTTFSGDAESAQKSLVALITDRPDLWMARALDPQAPQLLKNAADEFAKNNPRWTLEHLGDFDPATREPMIANILSSADNFFGSSLHPTLAGRNLTEWLEELTPEHRTSVIGGVAGMELMRDPDRALALAEEITDPKQRKVFYETVATFSAIEPRLLEKKLLQAKGTPEQIAQLRFAFAAGAQGTFSSPS